MKWTAGRGPTTVTTNALDHQFVMQPFSSKTSPSLRGSSNTHHREDQKEDTNTNSTSVASKIPTTTLIPSKSQASPVFVPWFAFNIIHRNERVAKSSAKQ